MTVAGSTDRQVLQQTGEIRARFETPAGFRIDGKIIARPVDVGSIVRRGDLIAALDPEPQRARVRAARADVAAAQAEFSRAQAEEARQKAVLEKGFVTRSQYDLALRNLQTARAQLEAARAQAQLAAQALGYTQLRADADGVITQVEAQPGQVVAAGQMVAFVVRPGEREALFNISESAFRQLRLNLPVRVSLLTDPSVTVVGQARYVAPQANPQTRTYDVRVSLPGAPAEMRLGATVRGEVDLPGEAATLLPGTALFASDGQPAVWVFDRRTGTAQLRRVAVLRHDSDAVLIARGLSRGDVVITAGINSLRPGERVRPAGRDGT